MGTEDEVGRWIPVSPVLLVTQWTRPNKPLYRRLWSPRVLLGYYRQLGTRW